MRKTKRKKPIPKPRKIFYVDTSKSVLSKEGIRYWKSSLVDEKGKEIASCVNSKVQWANGAEAFAILNAIYYFIKNKITKKITVFSDSKICVAALKRQKSYILDNKEISKYYKYIHLARELIKKHRLAIRFKWIKGEYNLADFYSRQEYKWHKPERQGKVLLT